MDGGWTPLPLLLTTKLIMTLLRHQKFIKTHKKHHHNHHTDTSTRPPFSFLFSAAAAVYGPNPNSKMRITRMRLITCVFTLMILTLGQAFNDEQNDQRSLSASQDRFVRFFVLESRAFFVSSKSYVNIKLKLTG